MNGPMIHYIIECMEAFFFLPDRTWESRCFKRQSYSRWAADEILAQCIDHPFLSLETIIEEFITLMSLYSQMSTNAEAKFMFEAAIGAAEDIQYYIYDNYYS